MILSYHAVPTEEEMFFISRPLQSDCFFVLDLAKMTDGEGKLA